MGLHKSLLRSLTVQTDMPALEQFPKADQVDSIVKWLFRRVSPPWVCPQVTCKYYFGLLAFLSEDWSKVCAFRTITFQAYS